MRRQVYGNIQAWRFRPRRKDTNFSKYILIAYAYSKLTRIHGMKNITTEEVMDKLDMFQARFGKVYEFGWWYLEQI